MRTITSCAKHLLTKFYRSGHLILFMISQTISVTLGFVTMVTAVSSSIPHNFVEENSFVCICICLAELISKVLNR